ncbi:ATP-binding protein [Clostridium tagluense]|uniref:AAA family ATPase n=1 Tax=Clostridium tagluense TaxID=360422 RepID=UPI001CF40774|nr:AAA family ATPase [Clostridium tagluense]MCB2312086.1 ATP-binding protein [Clostridium tagluense]MCB2316729.1 ATP-binding protein [Clostridium tagluense]MCB2321531.1 ATP-binding protein [Clostridium tagluense]MCB2326598.1 ATP-binding protein [Clostridium tagluense]MCB2331321.1 ATP-binding protein [Clostridium tagluense]
MRQDWLRGILDTIIDFKDDVPEGRVILENADFMDTEELLSRLNALFKLEEKVIEKKNSESYVTDTYENNVSHFATQLVMSMVSSHNKLKEYEAYRKLLGQRHVAYGFYSAIESRSIEDIKEYQSILAESSFKKLLYLGLVEFYQKFYGKFSDNEKAIKLLCQFYPKGIDLPKNTDDIVSTVYRHITSAGTPSDFGFAYKGIELISRYIDNLPIGIIDKLLQKYELYKIINEKVYRHQIFTIIENSSIDHNEKPKYKFSYLDSLILANYMNGSLYEKYGKDKSGFVSQYLMLKTDLSVEKIALIKQTMTDNIYAYWTNGCFMERHFVVDEKVVIKISLNTDKKEVWIIYADKPTIGKKFKFTYTDWMLNCYHSKETEQKLQDFVFEVGNGEKEIIYNHLTFSLFYLSNYRGVSEQLVDFDHKFTYDKDAKELRSAGIVSHVIPHFYGRKIYSLSCIVGKNGTGKSSTVDFLRGAFFKLLRLIGEYGVPCENGYVSEVTYEAYGILDKGCEFFVVFHLGSQPYYLTNIEDVAVTIAKPFSLSSYKSVNELSKVVYFSNMLSISQDNLYTDEDITLIHKSSENELAKSLSDFRQADYSEVASFMQKRKAIDIEKLKDNSTPVVNKDLCYQLAFLGYLSQEKLEYYFDMPAHKKFILKSALLGIEEVVVTVSYSLKDMIGGESQTLKPFLTSPDAKLQYFSSGQYAKFSFLAKLYWFLEGYQKYIQDFESMIGTNVFSRDESLLEGETALIFIDEGELYYHPEWQRSYIKTLVENINDTKTESKLQVVITTNSPFIISDILSEDITYLSKEEKDFDRTFGQNIHKLLKDNFFMSYTIGEYSRGVIENIMEWLYYEENGVDVGEELGRYFGNPIEPKDYCQKIRCLIEKIGEPIYREKLLDMLSESKLGKGFELEILLRQKSEIERKLEALEGQVKV